MNISGSGLRRQIGGFKAADSSDRNHLAIHGVIANGTGGREILRSHCSLRMTTLVPQHHSGRTIRVGSSLFFFRQLALKHVFNKRLQYAFGEQIMQLRLKLLKHSRHHGIHRVLVHFARVLVRGRRHEERNLGQRFTVRRRRSGNPLAIVGRVRHLGRWLLRRRLEE